MSAHRIAIGLLFITSVIWGATFVVVKNGLSSVSPEVLLVWRFLLAGSVLLVPAILTRQIDRRALRAGSVLGVFLFLGYWLQTRGLLTTTPLRSAFLTAVTVVFVPALELAFYRIRVSAAAIASSVLALAGTLVLVGGIAATISVGDVLTLLCALAFAVYVVLAARMSRESGAIGLAAVQLFVVAALSLPLTAVFRTGPVNRDAIVAIIVTALLATAAAFFFMMWAQARTTALEAAIILAFEPVAAAAASVMTGNEPLGTNSIAGGLMILVATILCQWKRT